MPQFSSHEVTAWFRNEVQSGRYFIHLLLAVAGIIVLILPALNNGFPLMFYDSGTYIMNGHNEVVPIDRPILYCLFISVFNSLWMAIIVQAMIVYYIIFRFVSTLEIKTNPALVTFVCVALLSALTSLSHYTSQIIPDILLSLSVLAFLSLMKSEKIHSAEIFLLLILIGFFNSTHLSNIPVYTASTVAFILLASLFPKITTLQLTRKKILFAAGALAFSWLTIPSVNYYYNRGFTFSEAKNVIMIANLAENGLLNKYLKKTCETQPNSLCEYQDSTMTIGFFLWDGKRSPLYKGGCYDTSFTDCWRKKNDEYGEIISGLFRDKEIRSELMDIAFNNSVRQMITFWHTQLPKNSEAQSVNYPIKKYYPEEYPNYKNSTQEYKALYFENQDLLLVLTVILSVLIILITVINGRYKKLPQGIQSLLVMLAFILPVNAVLCSALSTISFRYQGRLIWLVVFAALLILCIVFPLGSKPAEDGTGNKNSF